MTNLRELPMKYMVGLKFTDPAVIAESTKSLLQGSQEVTDKVLDTLTDVLTAILEMAGYDDFDRAAVQITSRIIACCRAAEFSLRSGHVVAANAMARDVLENYTACNYLANNREEATPWLAAKSLAERRQFEFSRVVKSFPQEEQSALKGMFDLFSSEAHTNHLTVSYVRFRLPAGVNFYLSGCYTPNIMVGIHTAYFGLLMEHLDRMCGWYSATPGVAEICSPEALEGLRNELVEVTERLIVLAEQAQRETDVSEHADNLSKDEIRVMKRVRNQFYASDSELS